MGIWDAYENRIKITGETQRDRVLFREKKYIIDKIKDSLSYFEAIVNGESQNVAIIDTEAMNEKTILSMPGETFPGGAIVEWADSYWLVTEKDPNIEVRTKGLMLQCNYLLKWVDTDKVVHEEWCVIEDGTKYMVGEEEGTASIGTEGNTRAALTIQRNEHTAKLNRTNRFIVDDDLTNNPHAFQLTKPLRVGRVYNNEGVYKFIIDETYITDDDNLELYIADYYKYFQKETSETDPDAGSIEEGNKTETDTSENTTKRKGWI